MFQVRFRRLFRIKLSTKNPRSSEVLKTNKGREFEVPKLLEIGRYFDRHPNLNAQMYGEQISSKKFGKFQGVFFPGCVL